MRETVKNANAQSKKKNHDITAKVLKMSLNKLQYATMKGKMESFGMNYEANSKIFRTSIKQ